MKTPANAAVALRNRKSKIQNPKSPAFSLPELLTTIAVIGILAAIGIQTYRGIQDSARETIARDNLALLNRGVLHFSQTNWDIVLTAVNSSANDELAILHTLQWRDPRNPTPGSPYISTNFSDTVSSSTDDYRIQWNGNAFELLLPGTAGTGLLTGESSPGGSTPYTFPDDYQPLGPTQHE
jgi:prepilin-type N-terminal cleavage/methylation domain-containing protein